MTIRAVDDYFLNKVREVYALNEQGRPYVRRTGGRGKTNMEGHVYFILYLGKGRKETQVRASHICWYLNKGEWPKLPLKTINGDREDIRIENLEEYVVVRRKAKKLEMVE